MKLFTLFTCLIVSILCMDGFTQAPSFSKVLKGGGTGKDIPHAIAIDAAGNIYMTGEFTGTGSFPPVSLTSAGNVDFCLVKYDSLFNAIWGIRGGGTLTDRGYGVVIDNEGSVYATGEYFGTAAFGSYSITSAGNLDAFLIKVDSSGNYIWLRDIKGVAQLAMRGMAVDNGNNIIILGYFGSSTAGQTTATLDSVILTTNGARDILLAKYSKDGTILWARNFGGVNSAEEGKAVTVDNDGNIYITGNFTGTAQFGDITLNGYNTTATDVFVAKISPAGTVLWANLAGGIKADEGNGITVDQLGNVYVSGRVDSVYAFDNNPSVLSKGGYDAFIAKYEANGNFQWVKTLGGTGQDYCNELIIDKDNNIVGFGNFIGTAYYETDSVVSVGSDDLFILALNSNGEKVYLKKVDGTGVDKGLTMESDFGGNIYMTGNFAGTITFDGFPLTSAGAEDIFIARFGNNPVPVELVSFNASVNGTSVTLNWETATEINNSGFEIQRSSDNITFRTVGFIKGNGTTTEKNRYSFTDAKLNNAVYYYRLKQVDMDGQYVYSNTIETNLETPSEFVLSQNYPNPFNPTTEVSFSLPVDATVTLSIYNTIGEKVQEISKNYSSGTYTEIINGNNLSSGIYFYNINAAGKNGLIFNSTKKMVLIK